MPEAVAGHPLVVAFVEEPLPHFGVKAVEQVEQGGGVPAHHGSGEGKGLAAVLGQDAGGYALPGVLLLVFVLFVGDEQVEEAAHFLFDVPG